MNASALVKVALSGLARLAVTRLTASRPAATGRAPARPASQGRRRGDAAPADGSSAYPGDYEGPLRPVYAPEADGDADPGEVVWAWVPYEEDHRRGKDRPALIVGRDGDWLLALPVTSKDHDRDAAQEAEAGRHWVDIGIGSWDARRRPSEARVDRVVRLAPQAVRRMGGRVDRHTFEAVVAHLSGHR